MTKEKEKELIERYQSGEEHCLYELVEMNEPLITCLLNRHYKYPNIIKDDLIQEARIGVIEAIKRCKPEMIDQFATYKSLWIRKYISMFIAKNANLGQGEQGEFHEESSEDKEKIEFFDWFDDFKKNLRFSDQEKEYILQHIYNGGVIKRSLAKKIRKYYENITTIRTKQG